MVLGGVVIVVLCPSTVETTVFGSLTIVCAGAVTVMFRPGTVVTDTEGFMVTLEPPSTAGTSLVKEGATTRYTVVDLEVCTADDVGIDLVVEFDRPEDLGVSESVTKRVDVLVIDSVGLIVTKRIEVLFKG